MLFEWFMMILFRRLKENISNITMFAFINMLIKHWNVFFIGIGYFKINVIR